MGEEFDGVISGTTSFGFFVELDNTVNGLVHISTLEDDYYEYHERTRTLEGLRTRRCFRLGDKVHVVLSRVNVDEHFLDFEFLGFCDDEESHRSSRRSRRKLWLPKTRRLRQKKEKTKRETFLVRSFAKQKKKRNAKKQEVNQSAEQSKRKKKKDAKIQIKPEKGNAEPWWSKKEKEENAMAQQEGIKIAATNRRQT